MAENDQGRSIEDIAADLKETRDRERAAKQEADKVPALRREIERLESVEKNLKDKLDSRAREAGDLETRVKELESEARDADELTDRVEQAELKYDEARSDIASLKDELAEQDRHIGVLEQGHTELRSQNKALQEKAELHDHLVDLGVVKGV